MVRFYVVVATLLALGACAPTPPPVPVGPWTPLNQGQWTSTQAELEVLPK
jgi:hypothetical protein